VFKRTKIVQLKEKFTIKIGHPNVKYKFFFFNENDNIISDLKCLSSVHVIYKHKFTSMKKFKFNFEKIFIDFD
jgi:hypothetical protein